MRVLPVLVDPFNPVFMAPDRDGLFRDVRGGISAAARATLALPVGTAQDGDFVPGGDTVLYRVPRAPAGSVVEVRLLYQTIRPSELEHLAEQPGPAALRFLDMIGPNAMAPLVVATARATVP